MKIKAIAAVSTNGVFGNTKTNNLPWSKQYPEDMKFFRTQTLNSTIIFGRKTFESFGSRPLPKRRNILISSKPSEVEGIETFSYINDAIKTCSNDVWLIGGLGIYKEAINIADELYITSIPEIIEGESLVYFPEIDMKLFEVSNSIILNEETKLTCNVYKRK